MLIAQKGHHNEHSVPAVRLVILFTKPSLSLLCDLCASVAKPNLQLKILIHQIFTVQPVKTSPTCSRLIHHFLGKTHALSPKPQPPDTSDGSFARTFALFDPSFSISVLSSS